MKNSVYVGLYASGGTSGLVCGPSSVELSSTYNNQFLYVLAIYSVQLMKVHGQKHYNYNNGNLYAAKKCYILSHMYLAMCYPQNTRRLLIMRYESNDTLWP